MAVLGKLLMGSQQRVDLPDFLSIESYVASDFKHLIKSFIGTTPLILKGFEIINASAAISSTSVSIKIADAVLYHPESSAGSFYYGLPEGDELSEPLVPELRLDATNYVYLTLSTVGRAQDSRAFWDVDFNGGQGGEFNQDINTESVITVQVNVSVSTFPEGGIPIAKIVTNATSIQKITDCRNMMFRLGSGGINPDPNNTYSFRALPTSDYKRNEPPVTIFNSAMQSPFFGGDKNIHTLKEWMDVVMTKILEMSGTTYWYESTVDMSLANIFSDTLGSSLKSKGRWVHDLASPGKIIWTDDIVYRKMNDPVDVIIRANTSGVQLLDDQVMYINFVRGDWINETNEMVTFTEGVNYINGSTGGGSFENLKIGDWIKKQSDDSNKYLRIIDFCSALNGVGTGSLPINAISIVVDGLYAGVNETVAAVYSKGEYTNSDVKVGNRADSTMFLFGGDFYWLANRSDTIQNVSNITGTVFSGNVEIVEADGVRAKVNFVSNHNLIDGDRITIEGAGSYNGSYKIEVSSNTQVIITTTVTGDATSATASWAIVTTSAVDLVSGFQLESANHSFESNQTIIMHSSFSMPYEGSYLINNRSDTTFQIAADSVKASSTFNPSATPTTATCARVNLKTEFGSARVIQGESIDINEPDTVNILNYIGMTSLAQSSPVYKLPTNYNTLKGFQNFNCSESDNLTDRVSKLTAMMGDRIQDRGLIITGRINVRNFTSGVNQVVTCDNDVYIEKPGSTRQKIDLPVSFNLPANHALTATIDRDGVAVITPVVEELGSPFLLEENKILLFYRFSSTSIYTWDNQEIVNTGGWVNEYETSQSKNVIVNERAGVRYNAVTEIVSYVNVLGSTIEIVMPGSANVTTVDTVAINALTPSMQEGEVAWVRVNRVGSKLINRLEYTPFPVVEDNDASGILYITDRSVVPTDQDVIVLYTVYEGSFIRLHHHQDSIGNVYEEVHGVLSPGTAPITILLPNDSRNFNETQYYVVGAGQLEVYLNGQRLTLNNDWSEVGAANTLSNQIQILQDLVAGDSITFRIGTTGAVYFSASPSDVGAENLQEAYNGGRTIATTSGNPVRVTGPIGAKALEVIGDVLIDGVLDPTAIELKPQASSPLSAQHGLWVNNDGDLIQERPTALPAQLNVTESILDLQVLVRQAETIMVADVGGNFTANNVEDVLTEIDGSITAVATATQGLIQDEADARVAADNLLNDRATVLEEFSNNVFVIMTSGGVTEGDIVYIDLNGKAVPANSDSITSCTSIIGLANSTVADGSSVKIQVCGRRAIKNGSFAGNLGQRVYVASAPGNGTLIAPTILNTVVFVIGYAVSATEIVIQPQFYKVN
jgi:hypothetical protein